MINNYTSDIKAKIQGKKTRQMKKYIYFRFLRDFERWLPVIIYVLVAHAQKKNSLIYVVEKSTTYYLPIWPQIGTHPGGCLCYLACAGAGKNLLKNHLVWFKMDKQQEEEKIKKEKQSDIRPKILCTCCKKLGANFLKCCKPERYVHTEEKTSAEFFKVSY